MSESRCVIVTGGSRGLGLALVKRLLETGHDVATCSRGPSDEIEALLEAVGDRRLHWSPCAIGDEHEEARFFTEAESWCGERGVHALVNNAGVAVEGILATLPNVEIERMLDINLLGAVRMARLALRHMLARHGGRIINVSSIVGSRGYNGLAAYAASKAGMDGLTRALAREVGRRAITVNSIAPGYLETDMSSGIDARQRQQIVNRTPLRRLGRVEDVVPAILFLLSDAASFITGQTIVVDGGISC